jgi:phosphatidylglycerol:prolipoprotein diacylglycerol transferase
VTFTNPLANALSGTPLGIRLHPTQLYDAAVELTNFLILYWLIKHKKNDGQVIGAYMFLYGVARYFMEFVRDDPERGSVFGGAMTGTQLISVVLVIAGGVLWLRRKKAQTAVARSSAAD